MATTHTTTPGVRAVRLTQLPATLMLCIREARIAVQVIFLGRFLCGAALSSTGLRVPTGRLALGGLVWAAAILYVYLLNGVTDVAEDRVNRSARPIASGRLKVTEAAQIADGSALLALLGSLALGWWMIALTALVLALGYAYSVPPLALKRWSAAAGLVTLVAGLITYAAGAVAADGRPGTALLVLAAAMSAWMALVGAQAKDLSDIDGDRAAGRRTVAVRRGEQWARRMVAGNALGVGGGFLVVALAVAPPLRWPAAVVLAGAVVLAACVLGGHSRGSRQRRRRPYRIFMVTQYAAHAAVVAGLLVG
ncbi:UbiA family prenyltransferase [Micromonospora auratinigra]|uniref:Chlorophyll synthase n=1 Tax=Micromonospora auratinigra TaxID=261654 RepID=A0A1A8ZG83_9ACTN|nr:UbiA family prenyltransferase [Micromonospora auratinigra]SBT42877.1 chlorophyll synthase [Micromonospora auratinigra]